jgi:hypothetical protein
MTIISNMYLQIKRSIEILEKKYFFPLRSKKTKTRNNNNKKQTER